MAKWRRQPLLSDSPPLAAVDLARLVLLSKHCRRVAQEVRAAQRKAFLRSVCEACGFASDGVGNEGRNETNTKIEHSESTNDCTSAHGTVKTKCMHHLRNVLVGFVGLGHDCLCGTVQWLLVVLGLAIPPETEDSSFHHTSSRKAATHHLNTSKCTKSSVGDEDEADADGKNHGEDHDEKGNVENNVDVHDEHLSSHVKACCGTLWHAMGGCGVGTSLEGPTLRLVGTRNVHVCGAAAFPAPVRSQRSYYILSPSPFTDVTNVNNLSEQCL